MESGRRCAYNLRSLLSFMLQKGESTSVWDSAEVLFLSGEGDNACATLNRQSITSSIRKSSGARCIASRAKRSRDISIAAAEAARAAAMLV